MAIRAFTLHSVDISLDTGPKNPRKKEIIALQWNYSVKLKVTLLQCKYKVILRSKRPLYSQTIHTIPAGF